MKKRIFTMLLSVTLIASLLVGCSKEEPKEEVLETIEVEDTVTPEPTKPVVEVDEIVQNAKDEKLPEFTVMNMDFGTLVRLGDNEDYPDALENLEIHYMGKVFQVALPKDMCVKFKFDNEAQQLDVYNKDESKRVWFFFTKMTLTEDEKVAMSDEDFKSYITKRVEKALDNAKVKTLVETKEMVVQSIPSQTSPWIGEFVLYSTFDNELFEKENENNEMVMYDNGWEYSFLYGDTNPSADPTLAAYIAESFKVVEYEDSYAASIKPELGEDNKMDATTMAKYGLPEGELTFPGETTLKDVQGRLDISIVGATEEEMITFMDDFSNLVELTDLLGVCETMDGKGIVEGSKTVPMLEMSFENNGAKYSFVVTNIQGNYMLTINKM